MMETIVFSLVTGLVITSLLTARDLRKIDEQFSELEARLALLEQEATDD